MTSPKASIFKAGNNPQDFHLLQVSRLVFFFVLAQICSSNAGLEGILVHFYQFHLSPHFLNGRGASPSAIHRFFFSRGELLEEGSMVLILSGLRHKQRFCFEIDVSLNITTIRCWCV